MLVIDPDECIDCGLCIPECPVNAIFPEDDVPENEREMLAVNADLAGQWPAITESKPPLPEADVWAEVADKLKFLER